MFLTPRTACHTKLLCFVKFEVSAVSTLCQALKTTVLLTGGLCSKLFGIGLMGYLAFQSMQVGEFRKIACKNGLREIFETWVDYC